MANGDFIDPREGLQEGTEIEQVEVVTCIEAQPQFARLLRRGAIHRQSRLRVMGVAFGIGSGVEFDAIGSCLAGILHHLRVSIDKDAHTDTGLPEGSDYRAEGG